LEGVDSHAGQGGNRSLVKTVEVGEGPLVLPGEGHDPREVSWVRTRGDKDPGGLTSGGATSATQVLQAGALLRVTWRAHELRVPWSRLGPVVLAEACFGHTPRRVRSLPRLPLVLVQGGDLREAVVGEGGDQRLAGKGVAVKRHPGRLGEVRVTM